MWNTLKQKNDVREEDNIQLLIKERKIGYVSAIPLRTPLNQLIRFIYPPTPTRSLFQDTKLHDFGG
jgi:hypothetical protein